MLWVYLADFIAVAKDQLGSHRASSQNHRITESRLGRGLGDALVQPKLPKLQEGAQTQEHFSEY